MESTSTRSGTALRFAREAPYEEWGVEDARITYLADEGRYAITYTGYSSAGPRVCLITTDDLLAPERYRRHGPRIAGDNKNCVVFPEKIDGKYVILHRPMPRIVCTRVAALEAEWPIDGVTLIEPRAGTWRSSRVGAGAPPIRTSAGWLFPFHGATSIEEGNVYSMGWCLLDVDRPESVRFISEDPALSPQAPYEIEERSIPQVDMANFRTGVRVVFPQGLVQRGDDLLVYYGAADVSVAAARVGRARPRHVDRVRDCTPPIGCSLKTRLRRSSQLACWQSHAIGACRLLPAQSSAAPLGISLEHLRRLGLDAVVNGRKVRVVALYAEAPDYRPTGSPARDGYEGIASVDDAARAAVVYLRDYEVSGDVRSRDEALGLLAFVSAMEQGDGEFVNFVDTQGRLNRHAPSSAKSMSYWAARSIWALGEAVRVLGADTVRLTGLRPVLDRALARMTREINAGRLIGGSATATAEALLGILALQRAEPSTADAALAARTAALLVPLSAGSATKAPWGARIDGPGAEWHAWGSRSTEALAVAAVVLDRPDFAQAAKQEADALLVALHARRTSPICN